MHVSFVENIVETRVSLVPRVCVHVRTVEDLSGIVNSPVLFHVTSTSCDQKADQKVKKTCHIFELNMNRKTFLYSNAFKFEFRR